MCIINFLTLAFYCNIFLQILEESSKTRGARLEDDFLSSSQEHMDKLPLKNMNDTRLSDVSDHNVAIIIILILLIVILLFFFKKDYDWRQYCSAHDSFQDDSLRTRLASQQLGPTHISSHPDTVSSAFEDTLSESMVC